jgi:hypothetical protein
MDPLVTRPRIRRIAVKRKSSVGQSRVRRGPVSHKNPRVLKGKVLVEDIKDLARRIGVDLSKADYEEARRILKGRSLSKDVIKVRRRQLA